MIISAGLENGDAIQLIEDKTTLKNGRTFLRIAVDEGVKEAVKVLVEELSSSTASLETQENMGYHATVYSQAEILEILIGVGINLGVVESLYGSTLLHRAALTGDSAMMNCLLSAGSPVNAVEKFEYIRPLHNAVFRNRCSSSEVVFLLVECGGCFPSNIPEMTSPFHEILQAAVVWW
jgi:ankyrin repeat protein